MVKAGAQLKGWEVEARKPAMNRTDQQSPSPVAPAGEPNRMAAAACRLSWQDFNKLSSILVDTLLLTFDRLIPNLDA